MSTIVKRTLAVFLAAVMAASMLSGCGSNAGDPPAGDNAGASGEQTMIEALAAAVGYRTDGNYSTEITVKDESFAGITAADVQVVYSVIDYDGYNAALREAENAEDVSFEQYVSGANATVTDVTVTDDKTMTLSFTDGRAADNFTSGYGVYIESKNIGAVVGVEFTEVTLTPQLEYVLASDKDIRLTLVLDEGEFAGDISEEDIRLHGSFEELKIESLSAAGKNLTMQLTGDLVKHESSGVYLDGFVDVYPGGILNAANIASVNIPVKTEAAYFVSSGITVSGGTVTIPLVLIDVVDVDALTADSFAFENGVVVTGCARDSDTQVTLTLTVDGASDGNSAAAALDGQTVRIGDFEFIAYLSSATFYPVFDYVEQDGDALNMTLELYASSGTFAKTLTSDMFSFGYDFAGASVVSVERTSDTTAELIISVPANGQTDETLDMDGEVAIAAGGLINSWGDASGSAVEYLRSYSQESMGRSTYSYLTSFSQNGSNIIATVGKYGAGQFGSLENMFTTLTLASNVGNVAIAGANMLQVILQMSGVLADPMVEQTQLLIDIKQDVEEIKNVLLEQTQLMQQLQATEYNTQLSSFDSNLSNLSTYCDYVEGFFTNAQELFTDLTQPEVLPDSATEEEKEANAQEWLQYNKDLLAEITKVASDPTDPNYSEFFTYTEKCAELERLYSLVTNAVISQNPGQNPINVFDDLCTFTCNFDITAYPLRTAYRANIQYNIERALALITLYYDFANHPQNEQCLTDVDLYNKVLNQLKSSAVKEVKVNNIYFYVIGEALDETYVWLARAGDTAAISIMDNVNNYNVYTNFTDTQKSSFVSRMNGRTLREELTLAKFTSVDEASTSDSIGFALSIEERSGGWDIWPFIRYNEYYADVVKWDDTGITKDVHQSSGDGWKIINNVRQWTRGYSYF